ncbi:5781_t:CDS:2, partial [Scutellospora calospora]
MKVFIDLEDKAADIGLGVDVGFWAPAPVPDIVELVAVPVGV